MALPRWLYIQVDIHSCVLLCSHFCRPLCGQLCSKPWAKFKTAQKPHPNVALPRNPRALFFKAVGPRIKIRLSDGPRNLGDFVTVASAAGWQFDNFDDFCLFLMKSRGRHSNAKKICLLKQNPRTERVTLSFRPSPGRNGISYYDSLDPYESFSTHKSTKEVCHPSER